jgi:uncharacterized protein YegL
MKNNMKRALGFSVLTLSVLAGFQNCGKVNFSAAAASAQANNPDGILSNTPCTLQNTTTAVNLKIIFMVDDSGSTATTDPKQGYRIKAVQDLISEYGGVSSFEFGYGYFNGTTSTIFDDSTMKFASSAKMPFGNSTDLNNALTAFENISPSGNTPYQAAFNGLQSSISTDQALGGASSWAYAVVFMSDGMPTDLTGNVQTDIVNLVDSLRGTVLKGGSTSTVSTVYFGPDSDGTSIANLTTMAKEGQGQFVDTNQTTSLNFAQVITVPGTNCPTN